MYQSGSSWMLLFYLPFIFTLYVGVLLGVLWVAVRVVRHAWYWHSSAADETSRDDPAQPPAQLP